MKLHVLFVIGLACYQDIDDCDTIKGAKAALAKIEGQITSFEKCS